MTHSHFATFLCFLGVVEYPECAVMPAIALEERVESRLGSSTVPPAEMVAVLVAVARDVFEDSAFEFVDWTAELRDLTLTAIQLYDGHCPPVPDDHASAEIRQYFRQSIFDTFPALLEAEELGT